MITKLGRRAPKFTDGRSITGNGVYFGSGEYAGVVVRSDDVHAASGNNAHINKGIKNTFKNKYL
jgi:hypothetical protein